VASDEDLVSFGVEALWELHVWAEEAPGEYLRLRSIGARLAALSRELTRRYYAADVKDLLVKIDEKDQELANLPNGAS